MKSEREGADRKLQKLFKQHVLHNLVESVNIVSRDLRIVGDLHLDLLLEPARCPQEGLHRRTEGAAQGTDRDHGSIHRAAKLSNVRSTYLRPL
jgi:hypothetical protein